MLSAYLRKKALLHDYEEAWFLLHGGTSNSVRVITY